MELPIKRLNRFEVNCIRISIRNWYTTVYSTVYSQKKTRTCSKILFQINHFYTINVNKHQNCNTSHWSAVIHKHLLWVVYSICELFQHWYGVKNIAQKRDILYFLFAILFHLIIRNLTGANTLSRKNIISKMTSKTNIRLWSDRR